MSVVKIGCTWDLLMCFQIASGLKRSAPYLSYVEGILVNANESVLI